MWNPMKIWQQQKLRKYYTRLRIEALEAKKSGDQKRYLALTAMADRMIDRVIY